MTNFFKKLQESKLIPDLEEVAVSFGINPYVDSYDYDIAGYLAIAQTAGVSITSLVKDYPEGLDTYDKILCMCWEQSQGNKDANSFYLSGALGMGITMYDVMRAVRLGHNKALLPMCPLQTVVLHALAELKFRNPRWWMLPELIPVSKILSIKVSRLIELLDKETVEMIVRKYVSFPLTFSGGDSLVFSGTLSELIEYGMEARNGMCKISIYETLRDSKSFMNMLCTETHEELLHKFNNHTLGIAELALLLSTSFRPADFFSDLSDEVQWSQAFAYPVGAPFRKFVSSLPMFGYSMPDLSIPRIVFNYDRNMILLHFENGVSLPKHSVSPNLGTTDFELSVDTTMKLPNDSYSFIPMTELWKYFIQLPLSDRKAILEVFNLYCFGERCHTLSNLFDNGILITDRNMRLKIDCVGVPIEAKFLTTIASEDGVHYSIYILDSPNHRTVVPIHSVVNFEYKGELFDVQSI